MQKHLNLFLSNYTCIAYENVLLLFVKNISNNNKVILL